MAVRGTQRVATPARPFGVLGGNSATNDRIDFDPSAFATQIEMHGQRLAWSRALRCPCQPVNEQTDQPDPDCNLCRGTAWAYFGPKQAQPLPQEGFSDVQRLAASHYGAFVIRGLVMGFGKEDTPWAQYGSWRSGSASVTVRSENRLGFMDRLVHLDSEIVYSEVLLAPVRHEVALPTRYFVSSDVQMVRSARRVLVSGTDYRTLGGRIYLCRREAASPGERLSVHYATFPTFMVIDIPSANRMTNLLQDGPPIPSAEGAPTLMPQRATLRLEFLPEMRDTAGAQND